MGFSHGLVAIHDLSPDEVAARLGRAVGDRTMGLGVAPTHDSPGWCASPPIDGWTFLVDKTQEVLFDEHGLARLSAGTRLLTLHIEEHVMGFGTTCWTEGSFTWKVIAAAENNGLYVIGDPPPFGDLVGDLHEGPDVVYALDELSGPPPELWDELGFDGANLPTARAAALGLTVRRTRAAPAFASFPTYRPSRSSPGSPDMPTTGGTACTPHNYKCWSRRAKSRDPVRTRKRRIVAVGHGIVCVGKNRKPLRSGAC
ncbi:hypothetical protein ACRYCC_10540 [Actinomadura scrupuli]|uniref:hypothetical protein n=1 Tax=Actinomadura scrupuli TaxID=559629 RepID=UPI003D971C85